MPKPYLPADTDGMLPYDSKKESSVGLSLEFVLKKLLEMCGTMLRCKEEEEAQKLNQEYPCNWKAK